VRRHVAQVGRDGAEPEPDLAGLVPGGKRAAVDPIVEDPGADDEDGD